MSGSDDVHDGDSVDRGIRAWMEIHPDLELSGTEIVARLLRLAAIADGQIVPALRRLGLTFHGYSVLAVLRSADPDREGFNGSEIAERSHLSSGGLTNLLHRLEADGLVERVADPHDGRATIVVLTERGAELADEAVVVVANEERAIVDELTARERSRLRGLLSRLLVSLEGDRLA